MNVQYQRNLSSNIYPNYNKVLQYNPLFSSPQKNSDNKYSFNYGMKHYYSAEINSYKKVTRDQKPIYILNPHFIEYQKIPPNNNLNQNILYSIPYQVHTANIHQMTNLNNINSIPNDINNINNKLNNNLLNNNVNTNNSVYYSQSTNNRIVSNPNQNVFNGQIIYTEYNQQNISNGDINQNINNIYYNTNPNNRINIIQEGPKIKNTLKLENLENPNFNNTMPNLRGNYEIYTQLKNEFDADVINERKTFQENHKIQELENYVYNEPMRQTENIIRINNISFPRDDNFFQNQIITQKQNTTNQGLQQEKVDNGNITNINNNLNTNIINNNNLNINLNFDINNINNNQNINNVNAIANINKNNYNENSDNNMINNNNNALNNNNIINQNNNKNNLSLQKEINIHKDNNPMNDLNKNIERPIINNENEKKIETNYKPLIINQLINTQNENNNNQNSNYSYKKSSEIELIDTIQKDNFLNQMKNKNIEKQILIKSRSDENIRINNNNNIINNFNLKEIENQKQIENNNQIKYYDISKEQNYINDERKDLNIEINQNNDINDELNNNQNLPNQNIQNYNYTNNNNNFVQNNSQIISPNDKSQIEEEKPITQENMKKNVSEINNNIRIETQSKINPNINNLKKENLIINNKINENILLNEQLKINNEYREDKNILNNNINIDKMNENINNNKLSSNNNIISENKIIYNNLKIIHNTKKENSNNIDLNNKIKNVIINGRKNNAKNKNKIYTEKKKSRRPVYKIPPSKKRSISEGKSLNFIHKYYDENFILEEESENEDNGSDIEENMKLNKSKSKHNFQEVKIEKILKNNDINTSDQDKININIINTKNNEENN